jgi:hypothetical protein
MNTKLKEVKIIYGSHEHHFKCYGCISRGLIVEANLPTTTLLTVLHSDGKGGYLPPLYYCSLHAMDAYEEMKQKLYRDYYQSGEDRKFVDYSTEKRAK